MKRKILFLLLPLLITSCATVQPSKSENNGSGDAQSSGQEQESSEQQDTSIIDVPDGDEYDAWLNSWSEPGHLYFHYNRGTKGGYDNYCLWLWQHSPQDLEGALYAYSSKTEVSKDLTLVPMTNHWMKASEVGKEGDDMYIDTYGVIADVDLNATGLVGGKVLKGKQPSPTTFDGMEELGFLIPQQNSMNGATNWVSDGGRETYIDDISIDDYPENWRTVTKDGVTGKAIHIFVSTGALYNYTYFAGSGVPEAITNPVELDTSGIYRSKFDNKYSANIGVTSTSEAFKELGVGYQIFVASFRDSDGDNIGDIRGIIDSLDYIKGLGAEVLWLTPIQKSDSYHGYDISDYYAVDKRFGTVEDYRELIYKAHEKGIKVLMDLVLNHTSKGNIWFTNSQWAVKDTESGINWRDVYNWKYATDTIEKYDPNQHKYVEITVKQDAESDNPSWYRDGESNYYYYGKFGSGMPEINYLNAATRKLVIDMAKYWMSFGLDGFRLDAIKHIFMRDECYQPTDVIAEDVGEKESFDDEKGISVTKAYDYSSNLTKNLVWWKEFAEGVKADYPNCFLVGENFDGWGTRTASYYQALDSQFNFSNYYHVPAYLYNNEGGAANYASKQAGETFIPFASSQDLVIDDGKTRYTIPGGNRQDFIDGAFTSNHDVMRAINQANGVGDLSSTTASNHITGVNDEVNKAKIHAALTILNPGVSWIYYGDELGMSSNTYQHKAMYGSENCEDIWFRQPFLWQTTSLRPNYKSGRYVFELDDYNKTLKTMEEQEADPTSMLNWYKALIAIKNQYPKGAKLSYDGSSSNNVLVLKVTGEGQALVIYINIGTSTSPYTMRPDAFLSANTTNIGVTYGAPNTKDADIGATKWAVSAFKK